jgi:GNAT superfamily N-acetyltransferase
VRRLSCTEGNDVKVEVARFSARMRAEWDAFVEHSNNGTIFHTQRFLEYHPPGRFVSHHLLFRRGGRLVAVFPGVHLREGPESVLSSHRGASYGGFVIPADLGLAGCVELVQALVAYAQEAGFNRIQLTLPPLLYYETPHNYLDFALFQSKFGYLKRELTAAIALDGGTEKLERAFKTESRTAIRRAEKLGVDVKASNDYRSFYPMLEENLWRKHRVRPTHSLEELLRLKKLMPEKIHLLMATLRGKPIAGMVLFSCNRNVALAFYITHIYEYQNYRALNLLFREAIGWASERGYSFLDLGTFTLNMEVDWGLCRFKENFTARGYFRDTWGYPHLI